MTLAEVFLLLLIVGWYGSRLESEERGIDSGGTVATVPKQKFDEAERLRREAEATANAAAQKYAELEKILDWIAQTAGLSRPITNLNAAKEAIAKVKSDVKRGRPACGTDNVLVNAVADRGTLSLALRQTFKVAERSYSAGTRLEGAKMQPLL